MSEKQKDTALYDVEVIEPRGSADHDERQRLRRELLAYAASVPDLALTIHWNGEVTLGCETARPVEGGWEWHGYREGMHQHLFFDAAEEIVGLLAAVRVESLEESARLVGMEVENLQAATGLEQGKVVLKQAIERSKRINELAIPGGVFGTVPRPDLARG